MVGYEDASVMEEYWLRSLGLLLEDRQCLRKCGWLTDSVINAGQVLLKTDYPQIGGLQPTTLGEVLGFTSQGSAFVQVIHTAGSHWITASNVGFQEGVVGICDSLPSCTTPTRRLKKNIASIVHTSNPQMIISYQEVQEQRGANDCGLFALAFATSLCTGEDPTKFTYIQHQLRNHLIACLEMQWMTPFPRQVRPQKRKNSVQRVEIVPLFCTCRLPGGKMVMYDMCGEWFHNNCIDVPKALLKSRNEWYCDGCKY